MSDQMRVISGAALFGRDADQALDENTPDHRGRGYFHAIRLVMVMAVAVAVRLLSRLLNHSRFGGAGCKPHSQSPFRENSTLQIGATIMSHQVGRVRRRLQGLTYLSDCAIPGR
jgi:hypothetical protein